MLIVPSQFFFEMLANPNRSMFPFDHFIVYINESSTLVKTYGYKCHAIGNILGNTLVPTKEPKKNRPQKHPKEKNWTVLRSMLSLLIGHMKNYGPKTVGHHFQPGVSPPTANGGENRAWVYI